MSCTYEVNIEIRIFDQILYVIGNSDIPPQLLQSDLSPNNT